MEIAKWFLIFLVIILLFFLVILRIIRHFIHFPIPSFLTKLIDNPIRRRFIQKPNLIADRMELQSGMVVVDIGPGKGSYTKTIAQRVLPCGKVFAVDISESVINSLKESVEKERIGNIKPQIDDVHNFSFANESVDRIIAIACLPEIPNPVGVLRECRRILKSEGLVSLCEFISDPDYPLRATEKKWAHKAGLKFYNEFGNFFSYQLNFKKN